ncbi:MAG: hypothetical protein ABWY47_17660 [Xanthobacteraceae bacterium]|jgi:hypothetical protein
MTAPFRPTRLMIALALTGVFADAVSAQEQRGACFDVLAGPAEMKPAGAILLNRCNGQTWILVRTYQAPAKGSPGHFVYRWSALASDGIEPRPRSGEPAAAAGDKCFTFQGRRFCE